MKIENNHAKTFTVKEIQIINFVSIATSLHIKYPNGVLFTKK